MPSAEHDVVVEMLAQRPELAVRLLEIATDFRAPREESVSVSTVSADLSTSDRNAYGDVAVAVERTPGDPLFGVSVEVQLGADPSREWVWPVYLVVLRRRLRQDTEMVVFCPDELVKRYRRPIRWGVTGAHSVQPTVVGYSDIPPITDRAAARALPELAVLSAAAHIRDSGCGSDVLGALRAALDSVASDLAARYINYVRVRNVDSEEILDMGFVFGRPFSEFDEYPKLVEAYKKLGMKRGLQQGLEQGREQGLEQGREQGLEQGREQGLAQAVVQVLESRGLRVDEHARKHLEECHDRATLEQWLSRATTVAGVDELFEPATDGC